MNETHDVMQLIQQWDRIIERNSILYRRISIHDDSARLQLLLPQTIRQELHTAKCSRSMRASRTRTNGEVGPRAMLVAWTT